MSAFDNDFGNYMRSKVARLKEQDKERVAAENGGVNSEIFKGVAIYVNGMTTPSSWELRDMVVANGGQYEQYYYKHTVTHIVSNSLPNSKQGSFKNSKVVKPQWILDSIKTGKVLPWSNYNALRPMPGQLRYPQQRIDAPSAEGRACRLPVEVLGSPIQDLQTELEHVKESFKGSSPEDVPLDASSSEEFADKGVELAEIETIGERKELDLNSPWIRQNISATPGFLKRYLSKSRLHHLSTWRSALKKLVGGNRTQPVDAKALTKDPFSRVIMHIDMDCFFAQVAVLNDPRLSSDDPICVAHDSATLSGRQQSKSNAEIASCNYKAREFGIRNGMWLNQARQLCPQLKVAPYLFGEYERISKKMYQVLTSRSSFVQACSVDEAFIDASALVAEISNGGESEKRETVAKRLKQEIYTATGCVASVGVAHNVGLARLSTRQAKPNGVFYLHPDRVTEFLSNEPVENMPGVGWQLSRTLKEDFKVSKIGDLAKVPLPALQKRFGPKVGQSLNDMAKGIDMRPLANVPRGTIGVDINWGIRFETQAQVDSFWLDLSKEVVDRLNDEGVLAGSMTVKMRMRRPGQGEAAKFLGCGICNLYSKQISIPQYSNDPDLLQKQAIACHSSWGVPVKEIRGMGLQLNKFRPVSKSGLKLEEWVKIPRLAEQQPVFEKLNYRAPVPDEIEWSVFNSLPLEIQRELCANGYKRPVSHNMDNQSLAIDAEAFEVDRASSELSEEDDAYYTTKAAPARCEDGRDFFSPNSGVKSRVSTNFYSIFSPEKCVNRASFEDQGTGKGKRPIKCHTSSIGLSPSQQIRHFRVPSTPSSVGRKPISGGSGGSKSALGKYTLDFTKSPSQRMEKRLRKSRVINDAGIKPKDPASKTLDSAEKSTSVAIDDLTLILGTPALGFSAANSPDDRGTGIGSNGLRQITQNDYNPSPSQVDEEVLNALPLSLRQQVEKEIQIEKRRKKVLSKFPSRVKLHDCVKIHNEGKAGVRATPDASKVIAKPVLEDARLPGDVRLLGFSSLSESFEIEKLLASWVKCCWQEFSCHGSSWAMTLKDAQLVEDFIYALLDELRDLQSVKKYYELVQHLILQTSRDSSEVDRAFWKGRWDLWLSKLSLKIERECLRQFQAVPNFLTGQVSSGNIFSLDGKDRRH